MSSERQLLSGATDPRLQSAILADPRKRRVLALLLEQSGPIPKRDLASHLTAREAKTLPSVMTEQAHRRILIDLSHRCLPELEAAGWIERRPAGIVTTEQVPVEGMDGWLSRGDDSDVPWDALAALLAHPRRQHIVSIIAKHSQPLPLDELGTALMASEQASRTTDRDGDKSTLLTTLHHVDLPTLEEVGLIEYDRDEKTITRYRSLETVSDWMDTASTTTDATDTSFRLRAGDWKRIKSIVEEVKHTCEEWARSARKRLLFILGRRSI